MLQLRAMVCASGPGHLWARAGLCRGARPPCASQMQTCPQGVTGLCERAGLVLQASVGPPHRWLKGARLRLLAADPDARFDRPPALQLRAALRPPWQRCRLYAGCFLPL